MESAIPRILFAGTNSGCGKTTITCAVLQALVNRGMRVGAFKCGPDYIDPMFHSRIIGAKAANLDSYFFDDNTLRFLLAQNASDRDISILEGVMGYYDGLALTSAKASTYAVAQITQTPTVLVVGAKGASLSILAVIQGFLDFCPENGIQGVILNQCTSAAYSALAGEIERGFAGRVRPLGFLPKLPECSLESRHLGLVTAAEVENLQEKLGTLAAQAEQTIALDELIQLANTAPTVCFQPVELPRFEKVRIAVAKDRAFCFYYEDSLEALKRMGAELVPFSPLTDCALPEDIQGLYLGGGYPELYAQKLSENASMRQSVKKALLEGLPCIAECGGFMYLTEAIGDFPMVGFLPGKSFDTGKLRRFGYICLKANHDTMLCKAGEEIPGHEFHHWDSDAPGDSFTASKASGKSWSCVHAAMRLYAGFPHFHFYANPSFGVNFYRACLEEKNHAGTHCPHGD